MTTTLRISTDPDGIKALRKLATLLTRVTHPSIVSVENTSFSKNRAEIALVPIDGTSLDTLRPANEDLVKIIAATAGALAHLHEQNVALGTIDPTEILVRKDQSIVLFGFDNAIEPADSQAKKHDVQELANLATSMLPTHDPLRDRINGVVTSPLRESFIRILNQAANGSLDARQLAEKLRHALWFDNDVSKTNHRTHTQKPRSKRKLAAVAITVLVASAIVVGTHLQSNAATKPPETSSAPSCQLRIEATIDVDDDGCADTVIINQAVVSINNERYTVGLPDDRLTIGNWQCNNKPTLALLRPSSGELFIFDTWPAVGKTVEPRKLVTPSPATDMHIEHANACDRMTVQTTTGVEHVDPRKS